MSEKLTWYQGVDHNSGIFAIPNGTMILQFPSAERKDQIIRNFVSDLSSLTVTDPESSELHPVVCCVCDGIPDRPQWSCWIGTERLALLCRKSNLDKSRVVGLYKPNLIASYTAQHPALEPYILSPRTKINRQDNTVLICKDCKHALEVAYDNAPRGGRKARPPINAIANGYLIGDAPLELTCLNEVELALVSRVRIYSQSWIFFAGCHQQIKGWHTFYRNRHTSNVASIQQLQLSGLKGSILVVLCGPFTPTQKALTMQQVAVNPDKVIRAFEWLRDNHLHYRLDDIPRPEDIPVPVIIEDNV